MDSSNYKCSLNKESLDKARIELNEDPSKRDMAVNAFRDWIKRQSTWLTTPTDTIFLLAFLRKSKFSLIAAQEKLVSYWVTRQAYPQYFSDVDYTEPNLVSILQSGSFYMLPKPDKHGRRILMIRIDRLEDIMANNSMTAADVKKMSSSLYDYCLMDENFQVNGLVWLADYTTSEWKHFEYVAKDVTDALNAITNSYPVRIRKGHAYLPPGQIRDTLMQIFSTSEDKIPERIELHTSSSWDGIYEDLGKAALPLEYLPLDYHGDNAGKDHDIIDQNVEEMTQPEVSAWLRDLSSGKYGVDETKRPGVLSGLVAMTSKLMSTSMHK